MYFIVPMPRSAESVFHPGVRIRASRYVGKGLLTYISESLTPIRKTLERRMAPGCADGDARIPSYQEEFVRSRSS
jgi:hypothetical protein